MATPRVTPTVKPTGRTLRDFPEWTAAREVLTNAESELDLAQHANREAREEIHRRGRGSYENDRIQAEADAMLGGTAVAVETLPDLKELDHAVRVAQAAVSKQIGICNDIARRCEQQAAAEERAADNADAVELVKLLRAAWAVRQRRIDRRASLRRRFAGNCSLPAHDVADRLVLYFESSLSQFIEAAGRFGIAIEESR